MCCTEVPDASGITAGFVIGLADADWDANPPAERARAKTTFFNMLPPKAMI